MLSFIKHNLSFTPKHLKVTYGDAKTTLYQLTVINELWKYYIGILQAIKIYYQTIKQGGANKPLS